MNNDIQRIWEAYARPTNEGDPSFGDDPSYPPAQYTASRTRIKPVQLPPRMQSLCDRLNGAFESRGILITPRLDWYDGPRGRETHGKYLSIVLGDAPSGPSTIMVAPTSDPHTFAVQVYDRWIMMQPNQLIAAIKEGDFTIS